MSERITEAAAFHGLAANPTLPRDDRLALALQALDIYEARVAELEAERDEALAEADDFEDEVEVHVDQIEARIDGALAVAEARGYDRAVANLRDHERTARFGVDRAISRRAADYLVATKESTP